MAKKFVNTLIKELLTKKESTRAWKDDMRDLYAKQYPHVIRITLKDLEEVFTHNLIFALHHNKSFDQIYNQYGLKTARQARAEKIQQYEHSEDFDEEDFGEDKFAPVTPEQQIDKAKKLRELVEIIDADVIIAGKKAARYCYNNMETLYKPHEGGEAWDDGGSWKIRGPVGLHVMRKSLINQLMDAGVDIIAKELDGKGKKYNGILSGRLEESKKKMGERTHFEHENATTVGMGHIKRLLNNRDTKLKAFPNNSVKHLQFTKGMDTIQEVFGPLLAEWDKIPKGQDAKSNYPAEYTEETSIEGSIGPSSLNPSGSESTDWKKLRPKLEKSLIRAWSKDPALKKFATREGSKPFVQRLGERAAALIMDDFVKATKGNKGIRVRKIQSFTEKKPKKTKSSVTVKGRKARTKKQGIKRKKYTSGIKTAGTSTAKRTVSKRKVGRSNLQLMALLNASLSEEVLNNMGGRRLNNITGRFAESVQVLKVYKGRGIGMPNIMYKYDIKPYGVFEPGLGKSPWATPDRDPKVLIDMSIREVAKKLKLFTLTTTRI